MNIPVAVWVADDQRVTDRPSSFVCFAIYKTMKTILFLFAMYGVLFVSLASAEKSATLPTKVQPAATSVTPTAAQLEKGLQSLSWPQFRAVIQAVPKLKAEVDAYGAFGWQYVQARYQSYRWQKSIDKLDAAQQRELGRLIVQAKAGKLAPRNEPAANWHNRQ